MTSDENPDGPNDPDTGEGETEVTVDAAALADDEVTTDAAQHPEDSATEGSASIDDLVAALGDDAPKAKAPKPDGDDAAPGVQLVESLPIDVEDDLSGVEGEASPRLVSIVESLLFASTKPLTVKKIRRLLKEPTARQVQLALKQLVEATRERGTVITQVAGGFVMRTHPENSRWVQRLLQARPVRLSRPQLESLAIIGYRQPITRAEIDHVRGVDSGAVLKLLMDKDLVKIVGRKEEPGRPMLYGTTVFFLEFFNLMSLRDLPDLQEFRELSDGTKAKLKEKMPEDEVEALGQEVLDFVASGEAEAEANAQADAEGRTEGEEAETDAEAETEGETEAEAEVEPDAEPSAPPEQAETEAEPGEPP